MDDIFEGWAALPASAPWTEWRTQFAYMLFMEYGSELDIGEQQIAVRMGSGLYGEGLNVKDACLRAIVEAKGSPATAKREAADAFAKGFEKAKRDYPEFYGTQEQP